MMYDAAMEVELIAMAHTLVQRMEDPHHIQLPTQQDMHRHHHVVMCTRRALHLLFLHHQLARDPCCSRDLFSWCMGSIWIR